MKRIKKALIGLAVGTVAALGVVGFAACGDKTVSGTAEGSYSYSVESWGTTYGVKVKITVEDNIIKSIETVDVEGWTEATDGWENQQTYLDGKDALLKKYVGLDIDDVAKIEVATVQTDNADAHEFKGQPVNKDGEGFNAYTVDDTDLIITNCTQSCGRLLLAVQDAISKL